MFFRHESCIRRAFRHEPVLIGFRIHPEVCNRPDVSRVEPNLDELVQTAPVLADVVRDLYTAVSCGAPSSWPPSRCGRQIEQRRSR
jgi:hypothetical protein